jgi:hypothetical protein
LELPEELCEALEVTVDGVAVETAEHLTPVAACSYYLGAFEDA